MRGAHFTSSHASSSCAHVVCLILRDFSTFLSLLSIFSPIILSFLLANNFFHDVGDQYPAHSRQCGPWHPCRVRPLTGYEPNDYHISETTQSYIQESSGENGSLNSHDLEYDDDTIGMALSSPLFTQEREDDASRRRAYHSHDEGLSSSQSPSVGHRTERPVVEQFDSQITNVRENPRRSSENEQIRILLERQ